MIQSLKQAHGPDLDPHALMKGTHGACTLADGNLYCRPDHPIHDRAYQEEAVKLFALLKYMSNLSLI